VRQCIWLAFIGGLTAGCGSKRIPEAQVAAEKTHFDTVVRPKLEAELARNYPSLGAVRWQQEFTQQNRSHNEPFPAGPAKVTGLSFHVVGSAGKAKVHMIGSYPASGSRAIHGSISVDQEGSWTAGEFPSRPLRDFGWPEAAIASLSEWGSGLKWRGSHAGVNYSAHTEHNEISSPTKQPSELGIYQITSSISLTIPR
jgi:hypothetical protein